MQLIGIGNDQRDLPFKIATVCGNGEGANVEPQRRDAVGELVDHAWPDVDTGDQQVGQELGFHRITPARFQHPVTEVGQ